MELDSIKITPLLDTLKLEKISDETYFSEQYKGFISNSRLGLLFEEDESGHIIPTPEKFFEGFKDQGYVPAFATGSAVHELVLQPEYFEMAPDLGKPTAKMGAMADKLYYKFLKGNITKEDIIQASNKVGYYKDKMTEERIADVLVKCTPYWNARKAKYPKKPNKDMIFLDTKNRENVLGCVNALLGNKQVVNLLHPEGEIDDPIIGNEQAILIDVKAEAPNGKSVILRLKAKLDNFSIDSEKNLCTVNDVKTIGKLLSEMDNNIKTFHYNRELALYSWLLKLCAKKFYNINNPDWAANYLCVSTVPSKGLTPGDPDKFYTKVRPMTMSELKEGWNEFSKLLKYVAKLMIYDGFTFAK